MSDQRTLRSIASNNKVPDSSAQLIIESKTYKADKPNHSESC